MEENDFRKHAKKLKNDLTNRGYQHEKITEEINRAGNLDRKALLTYKEKAVNEETPLIVTYNRNLPNLRQIIDSAWEHLHINPTEKVKF